MESTVKDTSVKAKAKDLTAEAKKAKDPRGQAHVLEDSITAKAKHRVRQPQTCPLQDW